MPRICTVCRHPERTTIDESLVLGQSLRNVAKRFGTSVTALFRHKDHIPQALARAKAAREEADAEKLHDSVLRLERKLDSYMLEADEVIEEARASGDSRLRLSAIKEGVAAARSLAPILDLRGRISGELCDKTQSQASAAAQVVLYLPTPRPTKGDNSVTIDDYRNAAPEFIRIEATANQTDAPSAPSTENSAVVPGATDCNPTGGEHER